MSVKMYYSVYILLTIVGLVCGQFDNDETNIPTYTPEDTEGMGEALFLTPYIRSGDIETAQDLALVRHPKLEWLTSYSGFLTVNRNYASNLFFWFCKAKENSEDAPVILWLQGGPGFTSLYGMFYENGPFYLTPELDFPPREHSWHLDHNIIYIDNPVGAGFSFTESEYGYSNNEMELAENLYRGLQQFFTLFPELRSNAFYLCGESFAGKYVPALGYLIHQKNPTAEENQFINLRGLSIGNGLSDPINQIRRSEYVYQIGLIDVHGKEMLEAAEDNCIQEIENGNQRAAFHTFNNMLFARNSILKNLTRLPELYNFVNSQEDVYPAFSAFLKNPEIRNAIHVGGRAFTGISFNNQAANHLIDVYMNSVVEYISELLSHYPMFFYSGQLDIEISYISTVRFLEKMEFKDREDYLSAPRHIWRVDGRVAGYTKQAGNLYDILVRNAGHMAPLDQPKWCLDLILHLTYGKTFE
ncbi:hypothetical protein DMENIID0001_076170 [Sergentomyia squamirostris]